MGADFSFLVDREKQVLAEEEPTFDPHYGFKGKRKKREMIATKEELVSAMVPIEKRDFCAHIYLEYLKCYNDKFPWVINCKPVIKKYRDCQYDDIIIRYKEYEREQRLRDRQRRIKAKEEAMNQLLSN